MKCDSPARWWKYIIPLLLCAPATLCAQDSAALIARVSQRAQQSREPLLRRHFESLAMMAADTTHGYSYSKENKTAAGEVLQFLDSAGRQWKTYVDGPRPLIMAFVSAYDHKKSFYWLFLPRNYDPARRDYPFYLELHGSGGGVNNNPFVMLFDPLRPRIAGVTEQGYRKEGFFILPWGRGDKWYRDTAEADIEECLQDFDRHFRTDPARQFIFGFSMGGAGAFNFAARHPERWTAVGMYSAAFRSFPDSNTIERLKPFPIWMAWGENESWAANNRLLKEEFIRRGFALKWKEIANTGHSYLGEYQANLMDWFLLQRKPISTKQP